MSIGHRFGQDGFSPVDALRNIVDGEPDSPDDAARSGGRRRTFMLIHLGVGTLGLAAMLVQFVLAEPLILEHVLAYLWLCVPLGAAAYTARRGSLPAAQAVSTTGLAAFIAYVCSVTGGLGSFAVFWLVVIPLEAMLSGSLLLVAWGGALSVLAAAGLYLGFGPGTLTATPLHAAGALSAVLYVAVLAGCALRLGRAQARQAARAGDAYRLMAQNTSEIITRHDADGAVAYCSAGARRVIGCAPAALHGQALRDRVHVTDRVTFLSALKLAAAGCESVAQFRCRMHGDEPVYRWLEITCRPETESSGFIGVVHDIHDAREREEALVAAQERAATESETKIRFLANVSHELRTPLNSVIGFSDMMSGDMADHLGLEQTKEYASLINKSGRHLLNVVNDVLDMSKIEAGHFRVTLEGFDAEGATREACNMVKPQMAEAGLKLTQAYADMPELMADSRAYRQILLNLLSNAQKFTDPGGTIAVTLSQRGRYAELTVRDSGIGIAAEDLPKLGQPFVQAQNNYDRAYEGTGLGLSVVKGLTELHGGRLDLESEPGLGTTVTVLLPLEPSKGAEVTRLDPKPNASDASIDETGNGRATMRSVA